MVQKYLQARASYDMPTHERGAYSARVLPMAAHNVQTTLGPLGNAVPKQAQALTWNGFHKIGKGGTLFTLGGDRSNLGRLTHINGKEMAWPVDLHAGTKYMTEPNPGAVWANAKGARTALRTNILEAAKKGPVYGAFAAMGPTAVDSANNMFDVLMAQVPGSGISKTDAKAFDDSLREGKHIKGSSEKDIQKREAVKEIMKNWPGIQNAEKARDFAKTISGGHRGAIVKYMEAAPWQKAGFPSVGITRAAITDPELLDVSGNMMGHHVVELDPDTYNKKNLAFEHSTYGWPTGGKLIGKLPFIERHVATPDFTEQQVMDKAVVKKTGEPLIIHPYSPNDQGRSSYRGNTEMRQAIQPINERMLESIQEKHGTSFADGGEVNAQSEKANALGFTHDLYHATRATEPFEKFQMKAGRQAHDLPGVHLGTLQAAEDRAKKYFGVKDWAKQKSFSVGDSERPSIMPLKVKLERPFLNQNGQPFTESQIRSKVKKFGKDNNLKGIYDPQIQFAKMLREKGYDHVPYINSVEDPGSVSVLHLKGENIRSRFAEFDPNRSSENNIMAANGGSIVKRALMLTSKKA
jgi:hypothetical protein